MNGTSSASAAPRLASLLDLTDRVAVVAGGAGAIGAAICVRLIECGATVYCLDRSGQQAPALTHAIACDLTDPAAVERAIADVDHTAGRLDIVVHAAGITRDARLWKASADDWRLVLETNLHSAFHLLHAAVPILRKTGQGSIVLISSINGERGKVGQSSYAASKAGLIALTKSVAKELASRNILVNAIAPGFIETEMSAAMTPEARAALNGLIPLERLGKTEDIAAVVVFLASDQASYITGQVIVVDGGMVM